MASSVARPRKTVEDLWALPEDVHGELIDGEIYVTPTPRDVHQDAVLALASAVLDHVRSGAGGRVLAAPFDVHLPSGSVVQPDVLWVSPDRTHIVRGWVYGAPDLVVEVVSPSHPERDRIVKRDLYAKNGVLEYWIVDPRDRTVEVFRLEGDSYVPAGFHTSGAPRLSRVLPGLSLRLDDLFPQPR